MAYDICPYVYLFIYLTHAARQQQNTGYQLTAVSEI